MNQGFKSTRFGIVSVFVTVLFIILIVSLGYVQLAKGSYYYRLSEENRIRILPLDGLRGDVFDCRGSLLAKNRLSFDIAIIPQELNSIETTLERLSRITAISVKNLKHALNYGYYNPFAPIVVVKDISQEKAFAVEEFRPQLNGLIIEAKPRRFYPYGEAVSHIIGHLGEIDKTELKRGKQYGYQMKDLIGRAGIERAYDDYIKGKSGGMQLEVDNHGRHIRTLGVRYPDKGKNVHLTIDIGLQRYLSQLFENKKGAAVIINPESGEILAMVSSPSYNPNVFIESKGAKEIRRILQNPSSPLLNRAADGIYPAGSIFKIVVAAAALESGKVSADTKFSCSGKYDLGGKQFFCWNLDGHGEQTMQDALTNSCNVFFYKVGMNLGQDLISEYALKFGLGEKSGIDLPSEGDGLVPNKSWKKSTRKESWYKGDTVNFSIGQGYLLVTPLQIARMISVIANGGYLVQPYLVKQIDSIDVSARKKEKIKLSPATIQVIKRGLAGAVNAPWGTGYRAHIPGVELLAKTGTAQAGRGRKSHGWFGGFSPGNNAKVCFVIFLEHGGSGGNEPAEIAGDMIKFLIRSNYL